MAEIRNYRLDQGFLWLYFNDTLYNSISGGGRIFEGTYTIEQCVQYLNQYAFLENEQWITLPIPYNPAMTAAIDTVKALFPSAVPLEHGADTPYTYNGNTGNYGRFGGGDNNLVFNGGKEDYDLISLRSQTYSVNDKGTYIFISILPTSYLANDTISFSNYDQKQKQIRIHLSPSSSQQGKYYIDVNKYYGTTTGTGPIAKYTDLPNINFYVIPSDPYAEGASAGTTGGGDGTADPSDDLGTEVIAEPTEPTVSAVATGFLSLWTGTAAQINDIATFLWNDLATVQDVVNALVRVVADPMKLIIGLSIVPSQGLHKGTSSPVTVGPFSTGLNLTKLTSQYFTVDCGSLSFDTVCGNTFLDYAPYSKFSIYLPYIGTRTVDANDFVGHTISVKYKGDALTGNCVAFILKDNSVMYQFAGSLSSNCPLSSNDWTQTIISAVQMAATGIAMAATGGAAAPAAAAMGASKASSLSSLALNAASNISSNTSQLSPQVMKSGAVSGASGLLGVQVPYIIREAVSYQDTTDFNTLGGYPSNIYSLLSDLTGYTEVQSIHLTGMTCTQAEMDEIETLLKQGVII